MIPRYTVVLRRPDYMGSAYPAYTIQQVTLPLGAVTLPDARRHTLATESAQVQAFLEDAEAVAPSDYALVVLFNETVNPVAFGED
jgi:hypothetical protein